MAKANYRVTVRKLLFFLKAAAVLLMTRPTAWQWEKEKLRREYEEMNH